MPDPFLEMLRKKNEVVIPHTVIVPKRETKPKVKPNPKPKQKPKVAYTPTLSELIEFAKTNTNFDVCKQFLKYNLSREDYLETFGKKRGGGGTRGASKDTIEMIALFNKYSKEAKKK